MNEATFQNTVNANSKVWGSGHLTQTEVDALFMHRRSLGSWRSVAEMVESGDHFSPEHISSLGLEDPEGSFLEAAVAHACSVAVDIFNDPARTPESSIWSYATKNRAYRAMKRYLEEFKRPDLLEQWTGDETKRLEDTGRVKTIRPENGKAPLKGIEKVEVYWPCQLFRVIEAIFYKTSEIELSEAHRKMMDKIYVPTVEIIIREAITQATTLEDLSVNIFIGTAQALKELKFPNELIAQVLVTGYSPGGPLKEHGQFRKVQGLWKMMLSGLMEIDLGLYEIIEEQVIAKIKAVAEM